MFLKVKSAFFAAALGLTGIMFGVEPASAILIRYDFNATYTDGNVASGMFTYNTVTPMVTDVSISTSGGSTYPARSFSQVIVEIDFGDQFAFAVVDPSDGPDFTGDPVLNLRFFINGDLLAPLIGFTDIGACSGPTCPGRGNVVNDVSSSLSGVVIAAPNTLALFGLGLAVVAFARRRKSLPEHP